MSISIFTDKAFEAERKVEQFTKGYKRTAKMRFQFKESHLQAWAANRCTVTSLTEENLQILKHQ